MFNVILIRFLVQNLNNINDNIIIFKNLCYPTIQLYKYMKLMRSASNDSGQTMAMRLLNASNAKPTKVFKAEQHRGAPFEMPGCTITNHVMEIYVKTSITKSHTKTESNKVVM